jgi:AhpD family alkylhydroperoxidase
MTKGIYKKFRKLTPNVTGGLVRMREDTFRDAVVPAKYKVLTALAVVVSQKCEPCMRAYTKMAVGMGATEEEIIEFLNVAMTEGGCPAEQWALKAYAAFKELKEGGEIDEAVCCREEEI